MSAPVRSSVTGMQFNVKKFVFPGGEMHVKLSPKERPFDDNPQFPEVFDMVFDFKETSDIMELLLVVDAIKQMGKLVGTLIMSYVPFARQDRVNVEGECFSLKVFCNMINQLNFNKVVIVDPHSDVTIALLENCVVFPQHEVALKFLEDKKDFYLICPDAGAMKKIYKLAEAYAKKTKQPRPIIIECSKHRNTTTGEITGINVNFGDLEGRSCYIVDDICDGGRTFVEIAKVLKTKNSGPISLIVSHGLFTAPTGLGVFDGLIDHVYTRNGKVK